MNTSFSGHYKSHIESLIEQKNAIGYPYATSARILKVFAAFCKIHYPDETVLTKEMAMHWAEKKQGEHVNYLARRITPIRKLAKYMIGMGIEAFVGWQQRRVDVDQPVTPAIDESRRQKTHEPRQADQLGA